MDTQTFITIIGLVLSSGVGLEVIKHYFGKRSLERKDERDGDAQEIDLAIKIRTQVMLETRAMHDDMIGLKLELKDVKSDVKYWQDKHETVFRENAQMQTQYILVASTLNNVITWLRQNNLEVPFQMPIIIDFTAKDKPHGA